MLGTQLKVCLSCSLKDSYSDHLGQRWEPNTFLGPNLDDVRVLMKLFTWWGQGQFGWYTRMCWLAGVGGCWPPPCRETKGKSLGASLGWPADVPGVAEILACSPTHLIPGSSPPTSYPVASPPTSYPVAPCCSLLSCSSSHHCYSY